MMMAVAEGSDAVLESLCAFVSQQASSESHAQGTLDMQDTDGLTALMRACKQGSASSTSLLLRFGASASQRSFRGESALTFALMYGRASCVETLVAACGFLDARSRSQPHGALLAAAELIAPVLSFLGTLQKLAGLDDAVMAPLLKTVGIGLLTQAACAVCQDAGQSSLAKTVELCGTFLAVYVSLPLAEAVLELLRKLIGG